MKKTNLLLADDHRIFMESLKVLLSKEDNIEVEGTAVNGKEVLQILEERGGEFDILISDLNMPEISGLEVARIVTKKYPDLKIIVLSMHTEELYIEELLQLGISGYILKSRGGEELIEAILSVQKGDDFFSPEVTEVIMRIIRRLNKSGKKGSYILTKREKEVLKLIGQGNTTKEISEKLSIAAPTIETHRRSVMQKTNSRNVLELVRFSIEHGYAPDFPVEKANNRDNV